MDPNARESVCGKCGYIVKGLSTLTCPECGSDLRDVGIVSHARPDSRPHLTRYLWPAMLFLGWTYLCAALYVIFLIPYRAVLFSPFQSFGGLIDREIWPYHGFCRRTVSLFPASKAFGKIILTENMILHSGGTGYQYRVGPFDGYDNADLTRWDIDVDLQNHDGGSRHLLIDVLHGMACSWTDSAGKPVAQKTPLDGQLVMNWLRDAGIDTALPQVQREAAALRGLVKDSATPGYWNAAWGRETVAPVGRLERIVLSQEQRASLEGTPLMWLDRSGSEQQSFGPIFHINWIGVPLIVLLWIGGLRFGVRRMQAAVHSKVKPAPTGSRTMSIMFTDMVGFTARASLESRGGLLSLIRRKRELVEGIVRKRHGLIVKTLGDGLLIAFDSATNAVLSGVEIQSALAKQNSTAGDDREKFELRIAISTGEVAWADDDVYGEAVNLASRVQQLAKAGEVWFTESTWAILNKAEVACERVGTFEVKGIVGAVPVYHPIPTVL